ncbi:ABC transporter ATP-binding protein [Enterovibrio norvegicus]|uniref:Branched-chain amino acid transport system ATP-binding protein n=1 Tax=Enterovibrio norvegicus DSM 15893 TaxID=1121869 RepID=A0A1I5UH12_9GAMM|nr:ATP-binding cassette domain-containing protein [Enterovibrio norvegicus]OEF49738.1 ABC transporter ATP-binding protein [Enterovibrio norvegicus]SFP94468.1 branched-chain amino acid transport system ATP-binding protein [Enterovibrio norvegicus DSM 15893]
MPVSLMDVKNLSGGYGDITVVKDVTLAVEKGEVVCLAGRNGVGKTTLLKLLSGALPITKGSISLTGSDVSRCNAFERQQKHITHGLQEQTVFSGLSVYDNLSLTGMWGDNPISKRLVEAFPIIERRYKVLAGKLSGGERKLVSFCRAIAEGGLITLLDEPTEGVQPENIQKMGDIIIEQARAGHSFIVAEQNLTLIEQIASACWVIDHGELISRYPASPTLRESIVKELVI